MFSVSIYYLNRYPGGKDLSQQKNSLSDTELLKIKIVIKAILQAKPLSA